MFRRSKNISGQKFGRLQPIEQARVGKGGHAIWLCKCDCGNFTEVWAGGLLSGKTKSCGCLQKELAGKRNLGRKGKESTAWKGDDATCSAVHKWLSENKPKPKLCERCKERMAVELSYNGKNGEWSRNPEDYEWLCGSCHCFKDKGKGTILTEGKILEIRDFYTQGALFQRELGELFRVSERTVWDIVNHKGAYSII